MICALNHTTHKTKIIDVDLHGRKMPDAPFINSDLKPSDVRSMCCRLQLNLKELRNKGGGLFGAGENTGSVGVVTINMPRIGYLAGTENEFLEHLEKMEEK